MPRMDGTGPQGQGPMTGRGMGPCGNCWKNGFGRFFRRSPQNRLQSLENEEKMLLKRLEEIKAENKD